jgi:hypothetical protein
MSFRIVGIVDINIYPLVPEADGKFEPKQLLMYGTYGMYGRCGIYNQRKNITNKSFAVLLHLHTMETC